MSKRTALYLRLSKDDEQQGESNSIINQRKLLEQYAQEHFFANLHYYIDDGYSGTNFDRPQIQQLFEDIQNGLVETVIVKDLSRFGRNHLMVGYYSEILFREQGVRFISVLDGVDSNEGENDLTAFKNILNEWYAKDILRSSEPLFRLVEMPEKDFVQIRPSDMQKMSMGSGTLMSREQRLFAEFSVCTLTDSPLLKYPEC